MANWRNRNAMLAAVYSTVNMIAWDGKRGGRVAEMWSVRSVGGNVDGAICFLMMLRRRCSCDVDLQSKRRVGLQTAYDLLGERRNETRNYLVLGLGVKMRMRFREL